MPQGRLARAPLPGMREREVAGTPSARVGVPFADPQSDDLSRLRYLRKVPASALRVCGDAAGSDLRHVAVCPMLHVVRLRILRLAAMMLLVPCLHPNAARIAPFMVDGLLSCVPVAFVQPSRWACSHQNRLRGSAGVGALVATCGCCHGVGALLRPLPVWCLLALLLLSALLFARGRRNTAFAATPLLSERLARETPTYAPACSRLDPLLTLGAHIGTCLAPLRLSPAGLRTSIPCVASRRPMCFWTTGPTRMMTVVFSRRASGRQSLSAQLAAMWRTVDDVGMVLVYILATGVRHQPLVRALLPHRRTRAPVDVLVMRIVALCGADAPPADRVRFFVSLRYDWLLRGRLPRKAGATMLRLWRNVTLTARRTGNLAQVRPFGCGHPTGSDDAHLVACGLFRPVRLALVGPAGCWPQHAGLVELLALRPFAVTEELVCGALMTDAALHVCYVRC